MNLRKLTITLAVALAAGNAAAGTLYAINDNDHSLFSIDTITLAVTTIGATGVGSGEFGDLAYDEGTGTMYWVAGRGNNNMYRIDLSTGAATLIGSHGIGDEFTLGWTGSTLFGQSTDGTVYTIDTATAAATAIGSNGVYPGGYDYNPSTGQLVLLEAGGGGFYSINQANGAATLLNIGPGFINDNDLAFDADTSSYWAIDYGGNLFQYDAATYARTTALSGLGSSAAIEYIGGQQVVPEPATLALLGLGLAGLGFSRRKQ